MILIIFGAAIGTYYYAKWQIRDRKADLSSLRDNFDVE
jgi:hypothetical protein